MIAPSEIIWIAAILAVAACVAVVLALLNRRHARMTVLNEVRRQFAGASILALASHACFHGLDRSWDGRWRGCGVLILTEEMLYFRSWQRKLDLSVPIVRVEEVGLSLDIEKEELDGNQLQVRYRGADDRLRVATWVVDRPRQWVHLVQTML